MDKNEVEYKIEWRKGKKKKRRRITMKGRGEEEKVLKYMGKKQVEG